jgi:hypothetical protein
VSRIEKVIVVRKLKCSSVGNDFGHALLVGQTVTSPSRNTKVSPLIVSKKNEQALKYKIKITLYDQVIFE